MYEHHVRHFITLLILYFMLMGIGLHITHPFVKCMHVSNACNIDFCLFIVLGDELLIPCIYLTLYLGHVYR